MGTVKKLPIRQCAGCGEKKNKKEMIRVLKTPEETITIDMTGRKNGRGAYICKELSCLEKALKNHGLERSLKTTIPVEIHESLKRELTQYDGE